MEQNGKYKLYFLYHPIWWTQFKTGRYSTPYTTAAVGVFTQRLVGPVRGGRSLALKIISQLQAWSYDIISFHYFLFDLMAELSLKYTIDFIMN